MEKSLKEVVKEAADLLHDNEIYFALVAMDMDGNIISHCCEDIELVAEEAIKNTILNNHISQN